MKKFFTILFLLPVVAWAQKGNFVVDPAYGTTTKVSTGYFGPNAFPIPDVLDGRTSSTMRFELAADGYWYQNSINREDHIGGWTSDIFARVVLPLFTDRANLTIWMPVYEWYNQPVKSGGAGDVYVTTQVQLNRERKRLPSFAFRAGLKTASGGQYERARHFDSPGYWFDLSGGKSIHFKNGRFVPYENRDSAFVEFRISADLGFLCWQTGKGRQNDAFYYGLQAKVQFEHFSLTETFSGYMGWEKDGDRPMSSKTRFSGHIKGFEPYVEYQIGNKDWYYHQLRVGLVYNLDVLNMAKEDKAAKAAH